MVKRYQIGGEFAPILASHLGGTAVALSGTARAVTPAAGCTSVYMRPNGAACYYQLGGTASAASYGYIPQDIGEYLFALDNIGTISVFMASGTVHLQYYQDV